jgi:ligand-binding sensor domain-containing protein
MKYIHLYAPFLMFVFQTSCGQNQTNVPQGKINSKTGPYSESQLKEADSSKVPVSMVRHVKQARNGDILIASYLGVFRYDGTSFTNITSTLISPRFSSFWDVLEDRKGNLWFGSKDSGVYLLPSGQTTFQHFTTKQGLASNYALHIYEDKAGNIWVGASRYDARLNDSVGQGKSFRTFTTKDGFPSNKIRLLLEDKTGKLWFGAQQEDMFVYDARLNGEVGQGKTFTVLKNKDGKAFNNVWGITEDRKGNIWFGGGGNDPTAYGLWRYDGTTFTKVSDRGAYGIIEDKKGNIWTTGELKPLGDWVLSRYDQKSLYNEKPTVTEIKSQSEMLLGILEDAKGNIWFGSGSGVYRYDGKTITDFKSKEGQK